jgi:hypothetical protein
MTTKFAKTNLPRQIYPQNLSHTFRIPELYKKSKADPLQAWSGPQSSRKLRFTDFMTTAKDGGKVVTLPHRPPLPPGNTHGTHFC